MLNDTEEVVRICSEMAAMVPENDSGSGGLSTLWSACFLFSCSRGPYRARLETV